ncbi:MAG: sigma-70 family RNA polymerase sigma factor [Gemmatales bacterium]
MSSRLLFNILKQSTLVPARDEDAVLLRRFRDDKDQLAFAEVVRRYGRLVWSVARQILPDEADAEDVFQATFLALMKASHTIKGPVAPWLHRVAFRITLKQRRTISRRQRRELQAARSEASHPIADSTWSDLLSAVHEEISKLPEHWRVPLVLCCLEGWTTTQAAQSTGWKFGTFSSRLSLAKKRLFERLGKRGLAVTSVALAIVTGGNASAIAPQLIQKAIQLASPAQAIPANLLTLVSGVVTMKSALFTSAIAIALILGAAGGSWWMVAAQGLPASGGPGQGPPSGGGSTGIVPAGGMPGAGAGMMGMGGGMPTASSKWKYEFFIINHPLSQVEIVNLLNKREAEGWDFVSVMQVKGDAVGLGGAAGRAGLGIGSSDGGSDGTTLNTAYLFRRPNSILNAGAGSMMVSPTGVERRSGPPGASVPGGEGIGIPGGPLGTGIGAPEGGGTAPSPSTASEAEVHQQLRGEWKGDWVTMSARPVKPFRSLIFQDQNKVLVDGRKVNYYINPNKSPAELNLVGDGTLLQCIYQVKEGKLTIAFYGRSEVDRPTSFDRIRSRPNQPVVFVDLQRMPTEGK